MWAPGARICCGTITQAGIITGIVYIISKRLLHTPCQVVPIPTNRPRQRDDRPARLYFDPEDKLRYLAQMVEDCWIDQRPLLIGTTSVNESERVLEALARHTPPWLRPQLTKVQLLNAKPGETTQSRISNACAALILSSACCVAAQLPGLLSHANRGLRCVTTSSSA